MLPENFLEEESLFRGVHEDQCDPSENRVFSSAFKDSQGASVDRSWHRSDQECINFLRGEKSFFAVAKVSIADVALCNCLPVYRFLPTNEYHSELHDELGRVSLRKSKASCISNKAQLVFINKK